MVDLIRKTANSNQGGELSEQDQTFPNGFSTEPNKWQTLILPGDVTAADTDFLEFTSLVVGKTYTYKGLLTIVTSGGVSNEATCYIRHGSTDVRTISYSSDNVDTNGTRNGTGFSYTFVATETSIKFRTASNFNSESSTVDRDFGGNICTWATLIEQNDLGAEANDLA